MHWIAVVVLLVVTVGYLFMGAAVFRKLEADREQETKAFSKDKIKEFLANASCVDPERLKQLLQVVLKAYDEGVTAIHSEPDNWSFWNSFFFSATVVTTIGYGHISPSTFGGRLFCIFYAIVGIPLVGFSLAGLGNKIFIPIKKFKKASSNKYIKILKSVVIAVLGFAILVILPSVGFHYRENWTMFESIYYSVITLATIGFGDFVVGQSDVTYSGWYKVLTIVWIFVGLAWCAVVLSDIGDYLKSKVEQKETNLLQRRKSKEFDAIRNDKRKRRYNPDEQINNSFSVI